VSAKDTLMQFAIFGSAQADSERPGAALVDEFLEFVDFNVETESLGHCASFLVEHHFTGWNQISATLQLLTWLAARTATLHLGTAVLVLPWHNPVLLAEQAATLDLMSGGRLDFEIGKGYRHTEFEGFCIRPEEAEARFDEALEIILKAWTTSGRFSHEGRFWRFKNVVVEPPPMQAPHPPLWIGAGSPASIKRAAQRGHNLILDQFASTSMLCERIALYEAEVAACGRRYDPMQVVVARDLFIVGNERETEDAIERNNRAHERTLSVSRAVSSGWLAHSRLFPHGGAAARVRADRHARRDRGEAPDITCRRCGIRDAQRRRLDREPAALRARGQAAPGRARAPRCNGRVIGRSNLIGAALRRGTRERLLARPVDLIEGDNTAPIVFIDI
jgi:alkanesulfonate monooxygenase SsuD/methylene tetrahydromethanopterin reductase-like flavin-dependent oxidoreductase (luciferase family)